VTKPEEKKLTTEEFMESFISGSEFGDGTMPPFKPGKPVDHPLGVIYQGPWETDADGFNEHVRRCARALALAGCPVQLQSLKPWVVEGEPKALPQSLAGILNCSLSHYSVRIQQFVLSTSMVHNLTTHRFLSANELRQHNYLRVISTVFERDRLGAELVRGLQRVGQIWVACEQNRRVLEEHGLERVRVVPIPYFEDDPLLKLRGRTRKPGPPRFYHVGKWEPRKAQDKLLLAFLRAFEPGEAYLVLKTKELVTPITGYPQGPAQAAAEALQDPSVRARGWTEATMNKCVQVASKRYTAEQMVKLHGACDVYLSLSRGEGWDMCAFDAKLAGNLLVYTPSGGPQDFAGPYDVEVPMESKILRHSFYDDWEEDACYGDYHVMDAVKAMRRAAALLQGGIKIGEQERPLLPQRLLQCRAETVGKAMLGYLEELLQPTGAPVFERGAAP
jgi:glycosyltransferase involved in cell wall biosynthesis